MKYSTLGVAAKETDASDIAKMAAMAVIPTILVLLIP